MQCSDMEDILSSYLDHELLPEESTFVEKHLQHCSSCRQALTDLQRTSKLLQTLPSVPMPDGFQEQLHELLVEVHGDLSGKREGQFGQRRFQGLFRSYRLVSAALIFVLCIAAYSFSALNKNMSDKEQSPALMNAEIALDQADRTESESREKVSQLEKDTNLNTLTKENESNLKLNKSQGHLFLILTLIIAVPLLIAGIISKFRRKH